jgi:hypothetical protein
VRDYPRLRLPLISCLLKRSWHTLPESARRRIVALRPKAILSDPARGGGSHRRVPRRGIICPVGCRRAFRLIPALLLNSAALFPPTPWRRVGRRLGGAARQRDEEHQQVKPDAIISAAAKRGREGGSPLQKLSSAGKFHDVWLDELAMKFLTKNTSIAVTRDLVAAPALPRQRRQQVQPPAPRSSAPCWPCARRRSHSATCPRQQRPS